MNSSVITRNTDRAGPLAKNVSSGVLCRAIVTVPNECHICDEDDERLVIFEVPEGKSAPIYLQDLLAQVWCVDTSSWLERGLIYNVKSAQQHMNAQGAYDDLCLFRAGQGSYNGVGPDLITYWRANEIDLMVTPKVARRLKGVVQDIEAMYL